ncbi:MAG: hypothetical protein ASUL_02889 [Candidatus Aramenus sulfurataquae]|uniref:Uncharacterized protein n=2 Tax=Candidatus Aramenus sulfurataquae TaxID=1326980 RepID=W7KKQ7_9CREN|nr:MAG: hypothetical protein ASUL_02889 [Candidatus Aramenus sulfurataquae]MCL7344783.1 hypothetical protein [Candidatus Aramenus sulfurataquae]
MGLTAEDVKREVLELLAKTKSSSILQAEEKYAIAMLVWANSSKSSFRQNLRSTFSEAFDLNELELIIISSDVEVLPSPDFKVGPYVTAGDVINDTVLKNCRKKLSDEAFRRVVTFCRMAVSLKNLTRVDTMFKYFIPLGCKELDGIVGQSDAHKVVVKLLLGIYVGHKERKVALFGFSPEVLKNGLSYCFEA